MFKKQCAKCKTIKPIDEFAYSHRYLDKRQPYCKVCANKMGRENYLKNKERYFNVAKKRDKELDKLIISYKSTPCTDCGIQYPAYVMDFDHLNDKTKSFGISHMRRRRMAFRKIIEEIKKCEVVCANCHRIRTNKRNPARWLK